MPLSVLKVSLKSRRQLDKVLLRLIGEAWLPITLAIQRLVRIDAGGEIIA